MTTVRTQIAAAPEGRGDRPSPRGGTPRRTLIGIALVAVLVGLLVGRFLTYDNEFAVPLPVVINPDVAGIQTLQDTVEENPDSVSGWQELGLAATRQAILTFDPAWYGIAEDAFARAVELEPDNPVTTVLRGQLVLSLHQFSQARELGLEATQALPSNSDAWGILVDAYVELGQYDDAAVALQTMLDLNPDVSALARASYLRQLNGDLDGAIIALRQAEAASGTAVSPSSSVSALLGEVLLHRGDLDGAQAAYERSPTAAGAAGLARVAAARGDRPLALRILTDLADRTPASPVLLALAEMQTRDGDEEGLANTVDLARTLAALQQDAGQVVDLELALFEASYGDSSRAVELAEEAYSARPDNVFVTGALAWARYVNGDVETARALAVQATRLNTVDTAHELRMAIITGDGMDALLRRNPLAEELFLP